MIKFNRKTGCCNVPYSVNISVTERCPLKCPFCFHEYDNYDELSFSQVCGYIDELVRMGTAQIQFSGGEPLVYPHILESISYAHSKGIRVVISTSGVTITEESARKLKEAGLDCCYISLNGSTAEIHEITRDGYKFAVNALEILKKIGLTSAINWVAGHDNVKDLENVVSLAKSMGVKHISVMPMKQCGSGKTFNELTLEDLVYIEEYCSRFKGYLAIDSCFEELNKVTVDRTYITTGCRAGKFYMAINAQGEFLSCPHLYAEGVKADSIKTYWDSDGFLNEHREGKKCMCLSFSEGK